MTIPEMVAEFHAAFGQSFGFGGSDDACRARLHEEEYRELVEALTSGDQVAIAHETADVVYVSYGTAFSHGLDIQPLIDRWRARDKFRSLEVCHLWTIRSLTRKDWGVNRARDQLKRSLAATVVCCYATASQWSVDLDVVIAEVHRANMSKVGPDGRMTLDERGKVVKLVGFRPPDVAAVLAALGKGANRGE